TGSLHVFDDLASPGADCNENGICDECDVINGTSTDCNGNLVPDECDILEGIVEDCNGNGRGDECEFAYQLDDGWWEYIINPVDVLQINQFTVREGEETIHGIRVFWRGKFTLSMPVTLALYDDPNNDGNPEDAVVLRTVAATSVALGGFYTVPIEPTVVGAAGDSFFVGALSSLVRVAADGTAPTSGRSWADLGSLGTLQIDDLSGVVAITDITCGGRCQFDFMIGAVAGPPVICSCSADLNGDGDVGFADMLRIITAWGPCGAPCPEDLNGNGSVDFADILVVIGAWGSCS
ncbi:MAG: hypothetical protein GY715_20470, partial [Planctomycetes bacterium]|nr:hypothetical protein [Planctomycetota bacterium]